MSFVTNPLVRPLIAIADGGQSDVNLLARRAAVEIERLEKRIRDLEYELKEQRRCGGNDWSQMAAEIDR